jgi:creatinine amidohydrolase
MSDADPVRRLASLTTDEAAGLLREGTALLLPVGSTEAHGPHLPLETDRIIAEETARRAVLLLEPQGIPALLLPALAYARAVSAAPFAGTVCLSPGSMRAWILDLVRSLSPPGGALLCLVNAHLEPEHIRSLRDSVDDLARKGHPVIFPDQTRRKHLERLGPEFRRGGAHAGAYETSLVLAAGGRVNEEVRTSLPPNFVDLASALRDGPADFRSVGGDRAYFGDPASASSAEGDRLYGILAGIVADAVHAALRGRPVG